MLQLLLSTFSAPRETIGKILEMDLTSFDVLRAAGLISCVSGIMGYGLAFYLHKSEPTQFQTPGSPFTSALVNFVLIYAVAFFIDRVGSFLRGKGTFDGALRVSIWSSLIGVVAILVSIVCLFLVPQLGLLTLTAFSAWSFVLLAIFIQVLHNFRSLPVTIAGMLGFGILLLITLSTVASMLGFVPEVA